MPNSSTRSSSGHTAATCRNRSAVITFHLLKLTLSTDWQQQSIDLKLCGLVHCDNGPILGSEKIYCALYNPQCFKVLPAHQLLYLLLFLRIHWLSDGLIAVFIGHYRAPETLARHNSHRQPWQLIPSLLLMLCVVAHLVQNGRVRVNSWLNQAALGEATVQVIPSLLVTHNTDAQSTWHHSINVLRLTCFQKSATLLITQISHGSRC